MKFICFSLEIHNNSVIYDVMGNKFKEVNEDNDGLDV